MTKTVAAIVVPIESESKRELPVEFDCDVLLFERKSEKGSLFFLSRLEAEGLRMIRLSAFTSVDEWFDL